MANLIGRGINKLRASFKPLTVHTEAAALDSVWEGIKKLALSGKVKTWYVMTPANYEYLCPILNLKITKKQFSETLKKRYLWLLEHGQKLELHVHLNMFMNISKKEQESLIKESIDWAKKELGISFREFVPGWWTDNLETREILKKYGLKRIKMADFRAIHDYDLARNNLIKG